MLAFGGTRECCFCLKEFEVMTVGQHFCTDECRSDADEIVTRMKNKVKKGD